ncbi:Ankyrin repeat domain-containing protein 17 [Metarhizium anisopliae]|nr:Ankyrin repeat domain-containing protein 17 [Metarhizium anisopliae]
MDPKSIASNTASLLALSIQVIAALHRHWDRDSTPIVDRLLYELARLRTTLTYLEESSLRSNIPIVVGDLPRVFRALKNVLVALGSKLFGDDEYGTEWQSSMSDLEPFALPLSKQEAEAIFNDFQVHIARLRASSLASIPDESISRMPSGGLNRSPLWNACAEYNEIHAASQSSRVQGSGVWLLSDSRFRNWMESDRIDMSRHENVIYCFGRPGSGKTILASAVIDELKSLRHHSSLGLAYFYLSYRNPTSVFSIVLTLIQQLYIQSPTLPTEVLALEHRDMPSVTELTGVLLSLFARFRKAFIVLDALDECSSEHRLGLDAFLGSLQSSHARLFVTSRPSHGLRDFDQCVNIHITPSSADMSLFVRSRLSKLSERITTFSRAQESKIEEELVAIGSKHGMFLLVELQLNSIFKLSENGLPEGFNIDDSLRNLAEDLGQVYDAQINRIMSQCTADSNLAKHILSWLFYSTGSMPASALEHVLKMETKDWQEKPTDSIDIPRIGKVCLDLVRYSSSTKSVVFFHFSLQEHLEKAYKLNPGLLIPSSVLAAACIKYLNGLDLAPTALTSEKYRQRLHEYPFYEYAAINWGRLLMFDRKVDFEDPALKLLVTDERRRLAVVEALFCEDAEFFRDSQKKRVGMLHFITYFGLLQRASGPPRYLAKGNISSRDFMGRTPIHIATMMGHAVALEVLFALPELKGRDRIHEAITSADTLRKTVWHYAAEGGDIDVVRVLEKKLLFLDKLAKPADFATRDDKSLTPLSYAAAHGHLEVLQLFLQHGLYDNETEDALQNAIHGRHTEIVRALLLHGVAPKYEHVAAASEIGSMDVIKLLLEYGAEIEGQGSGSGSALHKAARADRGVVLYNLIWNGASLEATDSKERTPLSIAVEHASLEAIKALLEAGSSPDVHVLKHTSDNKTISVKAAVWAAEHGRADIFNLLRRAGAECSEALFPAIESGHTDIVRQLLISGTMSELDEPKRAQAVSLAIEKGNIEVAGLLESWETRKSGQVQSKRLLKEKAPLYENIDTDFHNSTQRSRSNIRFTEAVESINNQDDSPPSQKAPALSKSPSSQSTETEKVIDKNLLSEAVLATTPIVSNYKADEASSDTEVEQHPHSPRDMSRPQLRISSMATPTGSKRSKTPFILIESPVSIGRIQLGTLVRNPNSPLQDFVPSNQQADLRLLIPEDAIHELHQSDFQMRREKKKQSSVGVFLSFGGAEANAETESQMAMKSPHVWREQLVHHDRILHHILAEPRYQQEYVHFIRKREAYMVVGLFIMDDSEVTQGDRIGSALETQPFVPVPIIEANLAGFATKKSSMVTARYKKGLIHAIQYRKVRLKTSYLSRFRPEHKRDIQVEVGPYVTGPDYVTVF